MRFSSYLLQELIAEIAVLEKQRDQLEAELKKVLTIVLVKFQEKKVNKMTG